MGDLVLTDDEVAPVMKALQQGGVEVTALHNHLVGESPKIMGRQGNVSGGVLHFNVPRAEKVTHGGMMTPPSLGAGTALNFQPTGDARAAIAGDFAMTAQEVGPVMKVLQDNGVQAVALHSHALDDVPRLFYMHFWANDDAVKLAKTLRGAIDATNSAK